MSRSVIRRSTWPIPGGRRQRTPAIRAYAVETGAAIITKDFAVHRILHEGPAVVWVRIGNTRRADLLRRFKIELPGVVAALEKGETLVELV